MASPAAAQTEEQSLPETPVNTNHPIEAEASSDYDSDSVKSDLTSLSSSVINYEYENGRRYHAFRAGRYLLPNDDTEQERLDILHHVFRLTLGGNLCLAELDNPTDILDIGTGTGIWAIEMGDLYPSARIIGTDMSPIQPEWVPPNVMFQIDDASETWAFPKSSFDLIHIRGLSGSIRDWPALLSQAYEHLKPGGKIELSEGRTRMCCEDGSYPTTSATYKWVSEFHKIALAGGLNFDQFPEYPDFLRQAGFQNVIADERPCPIGTWPKNKQLKEIGRFFKYQFLAGAVDSYSLALFTRMGGWSEAETQVMLAGVRKEFENNKMHVFTHCSYCVGTKPMNPRTPDRED